LKTGGAIDEIAYWREQVETPQYLSPMVDAV
jgi:hypothetical protein